jgi:hypothetical protein
MTMHPQPKSSAAGRNEHEGTAFQHATGEDRCAPRKRFAIPSTLKTADGLTFKTEVVDLSIAGFSATSNIELEVGTRCWLTLPGILMLAARVAWSKDGLTGCAFERLWDPGVCEQLLGRWAE